MASLARARRYFSLARQQRKLLREGVTALVLASLAIRLLPFSRVVRLIKAPRPMPPPREAGAQISKAAWAINLVADRIPWQAACFQRALALHLMLRRQGIGSVLHYGLGRTGHGPLSAHVWLNVGAETVIGGGAASDFARVAAFPNDDG